MPLALLTNKRERQTTMRTQYQSGITIQGRVERLQLLLGNVVLIPLKAMSKKPDIDGWQTLTTNAMTDSRHLRRLSKAENIGVLLGAASGALCTIDLDDDADVAPFLAANPRLRETTRTKRVRGCNIWVRIEGEYPSTKKLSLDGRAFGEWRANKSQTVIFGDAIDLKKGEVEPTSYVFLNEVPPISIRFDEIKFPDGVFSSKRTPTPTNSSESCILHSASLHSTSLHNTHALVGSIAAKIAAEKAFAEQRPRLARLYAEFIESRYPAQAGCRNSFLVEAIPFLYRAIGKSLVLELALHFFDCNQSIFNDPREQHLKEAQVMLNAVEQTYADSLSEDERAVLNVLNEQEKDVFRICRDLALLPGREPMTFFLSFNHLADRLGVFPMQAQRLMRRLESHGLIRQLKKGIRRGPGVRGEAGIYRWLLQSHK